MLNQKVKHFRNMSVKISHYIFSSLSKLLQLASDALEIWGRKYVQVILTLTSYLQMCKDKLFCGHYVFVMSGIYFSKCKLYLHIKT